MILTVTQSRSERMNNNNKTQQRTHISTATQNKIDIPRQFHMQIKRRNKMFWMNVCVYKYLGAARSNSVCCYQLIWIDFTSFDFLFAFSRVSLFAAALFKASSSVLRCYNQNKASSTTPDTNGILISVCTR